MKKTADPEQVAQFRKISRAYSDASILMHEAIARKAGLSGTDHKYLGLILQKGEMTAGEIAGITGLTTGAVTGLIDRLEKKKLVRRRLDKSDRRKVMVVPDTRRTAELMTPLFADLDQKSTDLIASFSDDEIQTIERYFREAVRIMRETTEQLTNPPS
ncbi:MAG TPA: MarR family transcriptional regulator [Flavilitoribacter sp.]|nr:MarR family transcriptional regulator [Flavilitoribacter sp.]HMQ88476.1 MarR family transcriptional regulator [Flavilitoribacter sp.]